MAAPPSTGISVFISHSSADALRASETARLLSDQGIACLLDQEVLRVGHSFVEFMGRALEAADYCLLLWSQAASASPWVQAEWHAAFAHSVGSRTSFLFTARLEDLPLPRLLAPRLWIDFFPDLSAGIDVLLRKFHMDTAASTAACKPIGAPRTGLPEPSGGASIYLTSELFDIVIPLSIEPAMPVGALLSSAVRSLALPTYQALDPNGRLAVRLTYELARGDAKIARDQTLAQAGIREGDVLQLLSACEIVSPTKPAAVEGAKVLFRSGASADAIADTQSPSEAAAIARARSLLRAALIRNGLAGAP
jgi:hypothetical protein